ncbi:MAG: xylulokinase [Candidatus Hodarchaeota archaeon]
MTYILALDLGTTGTRSVIFDDSGSMIGYSYEEWESFHPSPAEVEQDASKWWEATKKTIGEVLKKTSVSPRDIASVAVTNQRETIVPVDDKGNPLANAIVWQDRRTVKECDFIRSTLGSDLVYKTAGLTIDPYFSSSKILWFKNNRPEIYNNASKFLLVHDFILKRLTGEFVTDHSNASRTMLFDIKKLDWSDEILGKIGIDRDKLPEVKASGKQIGNISPGSDSGLDTSTLVITGAGDQQCAALGVGVTEPGRVKCTMGTGTFLIAYSKDIKLDQQKRVLCSCGAIEGTYVVEASMFSTGSLLRWARDNLGKAEVLKAEKENLSAYQIIDKLAEKSSIGANGLIFLPFIVGAGAPYWNPNARGVIFGLAAGHTRGDIYRSIMEGTSFDVKKNIEVFKELGLNISEIRLTGGGCRSRIWNQVLSDTSNVPCIKSEYEEATAMGCALLAATGAGIFKDISKAANDFIKIDAKFEPDSTNHALYSNVMALSSRLYDTLNEEKLFDDLQGLKS